MAADFPKENDKSANSFGDANSMVAAAASVMREFYASKVAAMNYDAVMNPGNHPSVKNTQKASSGVWAQGWDQKLGAHRTTS